MSVSVVGYPHEPYLVGSESWKLMIYYSTSSHHNPE